MIGEEECMRRGRFADTNGGLGICDAGGFWVGGLSCCFVRAGDGDGNGGG